jgi:integrase
MANIEKRTNDKGESSYRVKVRLKGHPAQSATFARLTDARKWAAQTESALREGRHFKYAEAKKHTLADLVDRYIQSVLVNKPKACRDYTRQLNFWKKEMGHLILIDLTPARIVEARDRLAAGIGGTGPRSQATVNRYMAALSHACTIAVKEWGWMEDNPLTKIARFRESSGRVRFLDDGERARLLEACRAASYPHLYLIVVLALSTGARKGEILGLRWPQVDFARRVIVLHDTKNKERRVLPLAGHALELLRTHEKVRRIDSDLLFPAHNPAKSFDIRASWEAALAKAGIADFRFHDLRHSAASYLAMNGATLAEIAEVLGHKTLQMVKRYAHLSEAHTSKVVARMNERIFGDG